MLSQVFLFPFFFFLFRFNVSLFFYLFLPRLSRPFFATSPLHVSARFPSHPSSRPTTFARCHPPDACARHVLLPFRFALPSSRGKIARKEKKQSEMEWRIRLAIISSPRFDERSVNELRPSLEPPRAALKFISALRKTGHAAENRSE